MSKEMEALRRSNASAGEAPNLPPHNRPDVSLPPSLMKVEFSGAERAAPGCPGRWRPTRRTHQALPGGPQTIVKHGQGYVKEYPWNGTRGHGRG